MLCDRDRCLRYRAPELRVVAEKDASPAPFQRLQPVERGQHGVAVVHVAGQAALAEGLTKVAGVRCEHDLTVIKPQPKGLVPRRVPVCRQTHHRAIAKHVVLAIDQPQFMAEVEIARVEAAPRGGVRIRSTQIYMGRNPDLGPGSLTIAGSRRVLLFGGKRDRGD